jgi:TldD protein
LSAAISSVTRMPDALNADPHGIDPTFAALPLSAMADAAIARARELGAEHADFRAERIRTQHINLRDGKLDGMSDAVDTGICVRVVHDGTWGFAAGVVPTPEAAVELAAQAVEVAKVCRPVNSEPVVLAAEPGYGDRTWTSTYEINPFDVSDADKVGKLEGWSRDLLAHEAVDHVDAAFMAVEEAKFVATVAGTRLTQQRIRVSATVRATAVDPATGAFESMTTTAPPVGRGWEYVLGTGWDWDAELAALPDLLAEKMSAPSVEAGRYDVVIDPTNLFLTIHESIGHATELDRALGYEAALAGTSFATVDKLGSLRYGSPVMTVIGDRDADHGLATIGWDDEGVAAQHWDLIRDGVLVGYQLDRRSAALTGFGGGRSNGCAFADSSAHVPIQRMANVSLQPDPDGPSTDELISRVERGLYLVGDNSWSIDQERYNFQFTAQRAFLIVNGKLAGQVKDFAYQATTTDFWGSMEAVGGPQTYLLCGTFYCGKGQPAQVAAVSHGSPSALFRNVNILNTVTEAGA